MSQLLTRRPDTEQPPPPPSSRSWWWVAAIVGVAGVVAMAVVGVAIAVASSSSTTKAATVPAAANPVFTGAQVPVTLKEFHVSLPSVVLSAGQKTFTISNAGTMQHELLVFHPDASIDPNHLPLGSDGDINEDAPGVNKISDGDNIDPGKSQTRQVDLTQPGTYIFVCNLPGHYQLGMWTKVVVH